MGGVVGCRLDVVATVSSVTNFQASISMSVGLSGLSDSRSMVIGSLGVELTGDWRLWSVGGCCCGGGLFCGVGSEG